MLFKKGDIVIGDDDCRYGITNENVVCMIVDIDEESEDDIEVCIVGFLNEDGESTYNDYAYRKDNSNTWWVDSDYFKQVPKERHDFVIDIEMESRVNKNGVTVLVRKEEKTMEQMEMFEQLKAMMPSADEIAESVIKKQKKTKKEEKQDDLMSIMMDAMAKTFAEINTDKLLEDVYPKIDKKIQSKYGFLPQLHEVKVLDKVTQVIGVTHEKFDTILSIVANNMPVYLHGPAGSGKNVICEQVATALGLPFYFTNAVTQEYKLTGFVDAGGVFHETQFYNAFKDGGLFFLDEMDASIPEVLIILNAALANGYFDFPIGRVKAHDNFRCIAAGNTKGTGADNNYTGRYCLDRASLDRFCMVDVDYSPKIEASMADNKTELLEFVKDFRKAADNCGIDCLFSYRSINRINKLEEIFDDLQEVIEMSLIKGIGYDDICLLAVNLKKDNKYTKCLKEWRK